MKNTFQFLAIWVTIILIVTNTTIVLGEEENNKNIYLEPIVVTASRIERRLSEIPSGVSVISEQEVKDSNAKSVPELLKDVEGIYIYDTSGDGTAGRINMRGFWGGMSTHQLVLIDGMPQNSGKDKLVDWNLIPIDNIERIEIVRGPASVLYGDNAMSGVINIITKKPSDRLGTKIAVSARSFNTRNYEISASRFFNKTGYYLGASRKATDGFRQHGEYENINLNGKLDFLVDDRQNLRLSLDYHEKERGAYPWAITEDQVEQDRRQARPGTENDKEEATKTAVSLDYNKEMETFYYANLASTFYYRYDDSEAFYTSGATATATKEQLGGEDTYGLFLRSSIKPEVFGVVNLITGGVDLERNNFDYQEYLAPYQVRGALQNDYTVIRDKAGPYLQDEIELFERLKVIIGWRYDSVSFDFRDNKNSANSKNKEMFRVTPHYGIVYNYQMNSNVYAKYCRAFRTPTIGQMFTYTTGANPNLNPEEAKNYEAGIRHYFNDYLKANTSIYWLELDNEIWYDYAAKKHNNYGITSHQGIETGFDCKIMEGLTGFLNYAYTKARNENGAYDGKYLTNIPRHKGSLGLKFEKKSGLKTNLVLTKMGDSYLDSANNDKLSGYNTVDSKITYEHKLWSAFLAVNNLLDKKYNSYGYKSGATKYFNPAPGRTITVGLEVKF